MKTILKKYRELNKEVKAGLWYTFCSFLNKGIALLVVPIYTRLLSTEDYGSYSVFQSWFNILLIITTLEISRGYFKVGLVQHEDSEDRYTFSLIVFSNIVTLCFILIYFLCPSVFNNLLGMKQSLIYLMIAYLLLYPIWEFWAIRQRFSYQYKSLVIATIVIAVTTPIIGVTGVYITDYDLESVVLGKIAVQLFICIGLYGFYAKRAGFSVDKTLWKAALLFNLPLLPYLLSTVVLNQADRIQITNICGATDTAIYSVAYSAAMILQLFNTAIGDSFVPWLYRALKNKRYEGIDRLTNQLSIMVAFVNLLLILFAPEIISIFAPAKYAEAIWVIPPVTASVYFMFLFQRYINVEVYYGENKKVSAYSIAVAVLNIVLNQFFISMFGYIAAAYTTLFCYVMFWIVHYFSVKRICIRKCDGFQIFKFKSSFLIGTAFLALVFLFTITYKTPLLRYGIVCVILVFAFINRKKIMDALLKIREKT